MHGHSRLLVVALIVATTTVAAVRAARPARQQAGAESAESLMMRASTAAYGLDHVEAKALARRAIQQAPDNAATHRTLASVIWQEILFKRGTVTLDHYLSGMDDAQEHLPDPPEDLDQEFLDALARSKDIAETELKRDRTSALANYDAGAAYGLEASYKASIGGSLRAALMTARRAFNAQERVLEIDPDHPSANTVVGTYRYVVSALGFASRIFAYIVGFGGDKERGIRMLEGAAAYPDAQTEARLALMLIYSREGRHDEAHEMALSVSALHPRNRLLVLEAGATALRAGRAEEAEAILATGLVAFADDPRPKAPGEQAIWLYKRGLARLNQNNPSGAERDFQAALESVPIGWMGGRIRIGLGKVADLAGEREAALSEYGQARDICRRFGDGRCEDESRQLQRRPFTLGGGTIQ